MAKNKPAQKEADETQEIFDNPPMIEETPEPIQETKTAMSILNIDPDDLSDEDEAELLALIERKRGAKAQRVLEDLGDCIDRLKDVVEKVGLNEGQRNTIKDFADNLNGYVRPVGFSQGFAKSKFERKARLDQKLPDRPPPEIKIGAYLEPLVKAVRQDLEMHKDTWVQSGDIAERKGADAGTILKVLKWMEIHGEVESQGNRRSLSFRIKQP